MCECKSHSYKFLFSDQFVNTVFWKSAIRYFIAQWTLRWQRKHTQMKTRKKLSLKLLGDVWIHLTELHLCFVEQSINTVFGETEKGFFGHFEAYADKVNFFRSKRERSILRNFFLISEFIAQTYNLDLRKQFANNLFVETAKWYLGAHRGPWWKRKYPQLITREKLSERFLSDVWLHHTEFQASLLGIVS